MVTSLVILGCSGSGKDTAARLLCNQYPNQYKIIKFSSVVKKCLADYLGLPYEVFEDRQFRVEPLGTSSKINLPHVSLLDLLVISYHIFQAVDPEYMPSRVLREQVENDSGSVGYIFTDVRTTTEVKLLTKALDKLSVILLDRNISQPLSSDQQLSSVVLEFMSLGYPVHVVDNNETEYELLESVLQYV